MVAARASSQSTRPSIYPLTQCRHTCAVDWETLEETPAIPSGLDSLVQAFLCILWLGQSCPSVFAHSVAWTVLSERFCAVAWTVLSKHFCAFCGLDKTAPTTRGCSGTTAPVMRFFEQPCADFDTLSMGVGWCVNRLTSARSELFACANDFPLDPTRRIVNRLTRRR
ncbi:MAG: hypothetical protein KatS3mg020_0660 [Fimbriimonadales bacterium]|nr:MAG: hypothetical protein KatS3mg020_0660 [Fimbriimonadales bacterium]